LAGVIRYFALLKLRLLRNGFKLGWQQVVGMVTAVLIAVPVSLSSAALLAVTPRVRPILGEALLIAVFLLLMLGWAAGPLVAFGTDETLDPSRLALLPLRPRQLLPGLLVASSLGVAPLATLVVLAGAVIGFLPFGLGVPLVVAAALVQFLLCMVTSRAVTTALSTVLRSRRARDLSIVMFSLALLAVALGGPILTGLVHALSHGEGEAVLEVVRLLPPGLAAGAMIDAAHGQLGTAATELAGAGLAVLLLAWAWLAATRRLATTVEPRSEAGERPGDLFPRLARFLPRNRVGAVAAKELRYAGREPRLRVSWIFAWLFALAVPVTIAVATPLRRPEMVLIVPALVWLTNVNTLNQFGFDGRAYWIHVAAPDDPRADLVGKNLAAALLTLPLVVFDGVAIAAVTGGWAYLPVAVGVGAGLLATMLGVGNYASVRVPQPMPEMTSNLWALSNTGQGATTALIQLAAFSVQSFTLAPVVGLLLLGLFVWPPALVAAPLLGLAYGVAMWQAGLRLATDWLTAHQPELLVTLNPRRTG
jgi:ABC-2 type transport system permease protein